MPAAARSEVVICGGLRNFRRIGKRPLLTLRAPLATVRAPGGAVGDDAGTNFAAASGRVSAASEKARLNLLK
jgi:hypothetical protein